LLEKTIESVLKQAFQDFELIVVDDGSTDDTYKVLKRYGERLRSFRQENGGPSAARNFGIQQAQASWISIQDSDDIAAPDHLETLYSFVEKNPQFGVVFANGGYLDDPGAKGKRIIPKNQSKRLAKKGVHLGDLFNKSIFRLQAAFLSKSAFLDIGGLDLDLRICHDLDLALRLFMRYPVAYVDKVVFFYRRHQGNIGRDQKLRLLENIRVIDKLVREFPNAIEVLGRRNINRRKAYRYYRLAKSYWSTGEKSAARDAITQAVLNRPLFLKYHLYRFWWH